jgi:plastocyanin
MYRWVGAIAAISLLTLTAACNSDDSASQKPGSTAGSPTPTPKAQLSSGPVSIKNNKVSPATVQVETGGTVKITNNDSVGHRLDNRENHLYSGTIPAHGKGEITMPPDPGTYVFADPNNSSVKLKVKVR